MPILFNPGKKKGIFMIPSGGTVAPTPVPSFTNTKSLDFDGVDDYVDCGNITTLNGVTEATWSCWFKLDTTDTAYIYSQWGAGVDAQVFVLLVPTATKIDVSLTTTSFRSTTSTLAIDTWYNLIVTFNGGNAPSSTRCKVYLDGVEQTNTGFTAPSSLSSSATNFHIGKRTDVTYLEINGNIDEFAIFDTELNQTEVTEIYNSGSPNDLATHSKSADLKHWWRMGDDATFPTIPDQIGSDDGTMTNMVAGDIDIDVP